MNINRRIELNVKNKFERAVLAKISPSLLRFAMSEWQRLCEKKAVDPGHNMNKPEVLVLNGFPKAYGEGILSGEIDESIAKIPDNSFDAVMKCKDCGAIYFFRQRTNIYGTLSWGWVRREGNLWSLCSEIRMDSALS